MRTEYRNLQTGRYEISAKLFLPDDGKVTGIILGVHGFAGDKESSMLAAVAQKGTPEGKALLCFDLPSHGESPVREDLFTIENCLQDLHFIAQYCREQFPGCPRYCFATSFGGFLTLLSAEELKDFKIILRAPAVTMPQNTFLHLKHLTAEMFKKAGAVNFAVDPGKSLMLDYSFYEDLCHYDVMEKNIEAEMLIIQGNADEIVPYTDVLAFYSSHPTMHLRIIPGADHRFNKPGEQEQVLAAAFEFWDPAE